MQSDVIFSAKLGSLRKGFKKEIDFTFIRAPHKVPSNNEISEENADENGVCYTGKKYLIESIAKLFRTIICVLFKKGASNIYMYLNYRVRMVV